MQNSLESSFRGLTHAIMLDIIAYKPIHQKDLFRDLSRIDSLVQNVGVRLFTEHLPALRKQLDSSLSNSQLVLEGPLTRAYKTGSRIPRLFRGMWAELFCEDGSLKQDIDPNIVLMFRTLLDAGSKYEMVPPLSALFAETRAFYENDVTLPPPSRLWDGDGRDMADYSFVSLIDILGDSADQQNLFGSHDSLDTELLATVQRVADMVAASFGTVNPQDISYRHGQGAVSDGLRGREKYLPTRWSQRLDRVFPLDLVALPIGLASNCALDIHTDVDLFGKVTYRDSGYYSDSYQYSNAELHSTLEAVPKTIKGPRLIAKEPSDHVQCQLGVMDHLYRSVATNTFLRKSIDFRRQDYSRDLALSSSRSGEYATIDLKSASDRISCWLIERIFRRNHSLLECLISCRTRFISLSKDKKLPSLHKLRKFSTQGSAVTFPIQSIVFAILCVGAVAPANATARTIRKLFTHVRVYGDDIIVPVDWLGTVKRLFEGLYLKINTTKTHSQGKFRESCGMDAWDGYDVTVPHVLRFIGQSKHRPTPSVVEASNNFFLKGLWHAADYLRSTVPYKDISSIPIRKSADVSIHFRSFLGNAWPENVKFREHKDYQTQQALILTKSSKSIPLVVSGSRDFCAFLMRAENMVREPFLGMVPEITFSSRWEVREKFSRTWVSIPNGI